MKTKLLKMIAYLDMIEEAKARNFAYWDEIEKRVDDRWYMNRVNINEQIILRLNNRIKQLKNEL